MVQKLSFGVEPNMREVPPGESATLKLANWDKWEIKETEYGTKFCIPVILFSHPSYESIPSKGWNVIGLVNQLQQNFCLVGYSMTT